jgi:hypothetical protein
MCGGGFRRIVEITSVAWNEFFIPLGSADLRNRDRLAPRGERIRVRLNGPWLDDFVVQYETPIAGKHHAVVVRSDGTHGPHYDRYDRFGHKRTDPLPAFLSRNQTVTWCIADIKANWRSTRRSFYEGLP